MPQPATKATIKTEGVESPGVPMLVDTGPSPAMVTIPGFGVVSASVNDDGYWKAHLMRVGGKDVETAPIDLFCHATPDDNLEVELLEDHGPGRHIVLILESMAGGGPTREMIANVLGFKYDLADTGRWWGTPHRALSGATPADTYEGNPDAVMHAARESVRLRGGDRA